MFIEIRGLVAATNRLGLLKVNLVEHFVSQVKLVL